MSTAGWPLLARGRRDGALRTVIGTASFGYPSYHLASLPDRLYGGLDAASRPPSLIQEPSVDVTPVPTPLDVLRADTPSEAWPTESLRSIHRLHALWALIEDRYRLLDAQRIEPLAHQASLVEHILREPHLSRVLIADEVGLGKTVEAGLLIKRLRESAENGVLRVIYLCPAALVDNVAEELERLDLRPRRWSSTHQEARLSPGDSDPLVIASTHRAVFRREGSVDHVATIKRSGPWDVVIVDEAHHLTDWTEDATSPGQRMRLIRDIVHNRLTPGGRLILLTATPHQGHDARYKNLLALLSDKGEHTGASGRIIYRIKDDIRDWDGRQLFPVRDVRPETAVVAGPDYHAWLDAVRAYFTADETDRAHAWRRATALQWCASSPQAGLVYLVRHALRSGWRPETHPALAEAMTCLRPYRGGPADEAIAALQARMSAGIADDDNGAGSEDADSAAALVPPELSAVLHLGAELVRSDAIACKLAPLFRWLDEAPDEKFVLFAQPLDTVYMLRDRLEQHLGAGTVSLVVGGQSPPVRRGEISAFWNDPQRRVLVSSRSGGEGINLQVARRLVHFDVPWNPMEMEQRVGRVHRFGGAQTILVETLLLQGTREEAVLRRARARLGKIVKDLDADRSAVLFARTMALIPWDEIAKLMAGEPVSGLTHNEEEHLDALVKRGYDDWKQADAAFRTQRVELTEMSRGHADDDELEFLLRAVVDAQPVPGCHRRVLTQNGATSQLELQPARVFDLPSGARGYIGRDGGIGIEVAPGTTARLERLGLNHPDIARRLRDVVEAPATSGAGVLLVDTAWWDDWTATAGLEGAFRAGALLFAYALRQLDIAGTPPREVATDLTFLLVGPAGDTSAEPSRPAIARLLAFLRQPRAKRTRPADFAWPAIAAHEAALVERLRRAAPGEPVTAVFPLAAFYLEPARGGAGAET
jgi:superfamily II DNA or RNA helicase